MLMPMKGDVNLWEGDLFNLLQLQEGDARGRDVYLRLATGERLVEIIIS